MVAFFISSFFFLFSSLSFYCKYRTVPIEKKMHSRVRNKFFYYYFDLSWTTSYRGRNYSTHTNRIYHYLYLSVFTIYTFPIVSSIQCMKIQLFKYHLNIHATFRIITLLFNHHIRMKRTCTSEEKKNEKKKVNAMCI